MVRSWNVRGHSVLPSLHTAGGSREEARARPGAGPEAGQRARYRRARRGRRRRRVLALPFRPLPAVIAAATLGNDSCERSRSVTWPAELRHIDFAYSEKDVVAARSLATRG